MSGYIRPVDNTATQHDGTETLAINDSIARRLLWVIALRIAARFARDCYPCVPVSKHLIIKSGPFVHLTEAATLAYLAEKTSLPVPHVHCAFVHKKQAVIVMERIQGTSLAEAWASWSDEDRESIFEQLRCMFRELRALPPPPDGGISSCVGGSLRDSRIPRSWPRFGPFKTTQDFHFWLRHELQLEQHPERKDDQDWKDIKEMVAKQDGHWPPPVFTHGDLNPSNILVRGNQVVGIIDWEFSGWYPHYWEYTSAWYWGLMRPWWQEAIAKFLDPHPEELKMEITRQKWWGE
jgi:serine/threonine protein kinase